jgi:large subunit ribosomal protein L9
VTSAAAGGIVTAIATATAREVSMPQAIMLQDHETLGDRGTVIDVSKGYLRNYLIPRKLAQPATRGAIQAAQRRAEAEGRAKEQAVARSQEHADLLNRTVLTITQQAGDDGRLFGSVTTQDIAQAIKDARSITVDRRRIHLEEPIRHVGTYMVVVELDDGVTSTVKTIVPES